MGASHGKTKKQQKEEARQWAETKDTEIATLYGENTKLMNDMRLLQADIQTMKRTMEQQQRIIENMSKDNAAMSRRFEEKLDECCPTTQEAHDAELQRMFDEEWELVLSSHKLVCSQARYMPGGKLDWEMLDDKGQQAVKILQLYGGILTGGQIVNEVDEMRKRHDREVKINKVEFKFEGNNFRSVAKVLFRHRNGFASIPFH